MTAWTDVETLATPDYPAAEKAVREARKPADDALTRWRAQQDAQDTAAVRTFNPRRSEYRLKWNADKTKATVQRRDLPLPEGG